MARSALLLIGLLALAGCGGERAETATSSEIEAMAGTWVGSYGVAGKEATGRIALTVLPRSRKATLSGSASDAERGETTFVSGAIEPWLANAAQPERCHAEVWVGFADPITDMIGYRVYSGTASLDDQGRLVVLHDEPSVLDGVTLGTLEDFVLTRTSAEP